MGQLKPFPGPQSCYIRVCLWHLSVALALARLLGALARDPLVVEDAPGIMAEGGVEEALVKGGLQ